MTNHISTLNAQLFSAIESNDINAVSVLLEKGVSPNEPSLIEPHFRPLEFAIDELEFECTLEIVKRLIEHGADVNGCDITQSTTPIHHAMCTLNINCIQLLLERGADPNIVSDTGDLALTYIADAGALDIAQLLLAYGASKTMNDFHALPPFNPLVAAMLNLDYEMTKLLLRNGADPNAMNEDGLSAQSFLPEQNQSNAEKVKLIKTLLNEYETT